MASINWQCQTVFVLITPFTIVIQPIRPNIAPTAVNLSVIPILKFQQFRRTRPVIYAAPRIESPRLANSQYIRDLIEGGTLIYIQFIRAKANIAIEVAVGNLDAGHVLRYYGFYWANGEAVVVCYNLLKTGGNTVFIFLGHILGPVSSYSWREGQKSAPFTMPRWTLRLVHPITRRRTNLRQLVAFSVYMGTMRNLLSKPEHWRIDGNLVRWFKGYLTGPRRV